MANNPWRMESIKNGMFLGVLFGLLVASSSILWIQNISDFVVNLVPYSFSFKEYVVWGLIGAILGYIIDKR